MTSVDGVLPIRLDGPLYTANVLANENAILDQAAAHPGIRVVALELTRISITSVTVIDTLADLDRELGGLGIELRLAVAELGRRRDRAADELVPRARGVGPAIRDARRGRGRRPDAEG